MSTWHGFQYKQKLRRKEFTWYSPFYLLNSLCQSEGKAISLTGKYMGRFAGNISNNPWICIRKIRDLEKSFILVQNSTKVRSMQEHLPSPSELKAAQHLILQNLYVQRIISLRVLLKLHEWKCLSKYSFYRLKVKFFYSISLNHQNWYPTTNQFQCCLTFRRNGSCSYYLLL